MPDQLIDLPFDPTTQDIICRRDGGRIGIKHFNIEQTHRHHSPTGMNWGYGGSGPADFALNALAIFLPPLAPSRAPRDNAAGGRGPLGAGGRNDDDGSGA